MACLKTVIALFDNGMIKEEQTLLTKEEVQEVINKLSYDRKEEDLH